MKRIFTMQVYMQGALQKKAIHSFFFEALYRKSLNTICIAFRFYNQKLSQERCFKPCAITARFTKEATDSFEEN